MQTKAIFLDRDGVLNDAMVKNGKPYPPASLQELSISPEVLPALLTLQALGFLLIGVTNQPDVARGTTLRTTVESINQVLLHHLPLTEIRVCYHDDQDACQCRKPLPGLILTAAKEHGIDLARSIMIGDRWKDIAAGQAAGCKAIWLDYGYKELAPQIPADFVAKSFKEAAAWVTSQ